MSFVIGGRVTLAPDDVYAGVSCEVDRIVAEPVQFGALAKAAAVAAAGDGVASVVTLRDLYGYFAAVARPVWNLVDAAGPVPATDAGMLRVPVALMLQLVDLWTDTLGEAGAGSAVPSADPDAPGAAGAEADDPDAPAVMAAFSTLSRASRKKAG